MALRLRLSAAEELDETVAFAPGRLVERQLERITHGRNRGRGRLQALAALQLRGGELVEFGPLRLGELLVAIARKHQRPFFRDDTPRERDGRGGHIALDDLVDQSVLQCVLRGDRIAGQDHGQRLLYADEARQALRAAGARDEAELDLRQAGARSRRGEAEMATERNLETAAEWRAVQRRDHRLAYRLDRRDHVPCARRLRPLAELADVGARDEGTARAGDHDGFHARIGLGLVERRDQADPHGVPQGIDRRVVDRDDADIAVAAVTDKI